MTRTMVAALAAGSLLALGGCQKPAAADSLTALGGSWIEDVSTEKTVGKPDVLLVKDGQFSCSSCVPPVAIPADGAFHVVAGRAYADSMSVKVDSDRTVTRVSRKAGKETGRATMTALADGKSLTVDWRDSSTPGAAPISGEVIERRVAAAPAGAHAISGSWQADKVGSQSANASTVSYRLDGDRLTTDFSGRSYTARIGGPEVPVKGDIGGTTVSVDKIGDGAIRETFHRGGKVVFVVTSRLGAAGKLAVTEEDRQGGSTIRYLSSKR